MTGFKGDSQWAEGDQNVQLRDISNSIVTVQFGRPRKLPLEPALVPLGSDARSPSQLVRARAGVVPYTGRENLREDLLEWIFQPGTPFAGCLIGGPGGTGKTRVAVELCGRATAVGWTAGLLIRDPDHASVEALADHQAPRLVVVDYAETRPQQLEFLTALLAASGSASYPVRVLLLVRARPRQAADYTAALRHRGDQLDALLDTFDTHALDTMPLNEAERERLFGAAYSAIAARAHQSPGSSARNPQLSAAAFADPLMVTVAAYLAVHNPGGSIPTAREALLDELIAHEGHYWMHEAGARALDSDPILHQRVVALATLTGADSEAEGAELLGIVPDLTGESERLCRRLARWVHDMYPFGDRYWNPIEPDLIGERLVARTYGQSADVLASVIDRGNPAGLHQPVRLLARAAHDDARLRRSLTEIIGLRLRRLCTLAVEQAGSQTRLDALFGENHLAVALDRLIGVVPVGAESLQAAVDILPPNSDLILDHLACTLSGELTEHVRVSSVDDMRRRQRYAAHLANHAARLARVGRDAEALAASTDAIVHYREIARTPGASVLRDFATALNNHSTALKKMGGGREALAAVDEAIGIFVLADAPVPPETRRLHASALHNRSLLLSAGGRQSDALAAISQAVEKARSIADGAGAADLASHLDRQAISLADAGRLTEAVAASEEAVAIYSRLATGNLAGYARDLAAALNTLSNRLAVQHRYADALNAIEQCVEVRRRLADADRAQAEDLALSLSNSSQRFADVGRLEEALQRSEEAVAVVSSLRDEYRSDVRWISALCLGRLASRYHDHGRATEAAGVASQVVVLRRELAPIISGNGRSSLDLVHALCMLAVYERAAQRAAEAGAAAVEAAEAMRVLGDDERQIEACDHVRVLLDVSEVLAKAKHPNEALAHSGEAVAVARGVATSDLSHHLELQALALHAHSLRLAIAGDRSPASARDAFEAIKESISIFERLETRNPHAYAAYLADAIDVCAIIMEGTGSDPDQVVRLRRAAAQRRLPDMAVVPAREHSLAVTDERERAVAELTRALGASDRGVLAALAASVDDDPIALQMTVAYCREQGMSADAYLNRVRQRDPIYFAVDHEPGERRALKYVTELTLQAIELPAAVAAARMCAHLDHAGIPIELLRAWGDAASPPLSTAAVDEAISMLSAYALMAAAADSRLTMHREVAEFVRTACEPATQRSVAARAVQALREVWPARCWERENWGVCERLTVHVDRATEHAARLRAAPDQTADLLSTYAAYLVESGNSTKAGAATDRAVAILESVYGPKAPAVAGALIEHGNAFLQAGATDAAVEAFSRALAIREATDGSTHPRVAGALTNLAVALHKRGEAAAAIERLQRAVSIYQAADEIDHDSLARTLTNLGTVSMEVGEFERARVARSQAVKCRETALGSEHPEVAEDLRSLASTHERLGDLEQASGLLERAVAILRPAGGGWEATFAATLADCGGVLQRLGRTDDALRVQQEACAVLESVHGSTDIRLARAWNSLALLRERVGDISGGYEAHARTVAILASIQPPPHPDYAIAQSGAGDAAYKLGRLEQARYHLQLAIAAFDERGSDHDTAPHAHDVLGIVLRRLGDLQGSCAAHRRAIAIADTLGEGTRVERAILLGNLGCTLLDLGDLEGARAAQERALALDEVRFGPHSNQVAFSLGNLGNVLVRLGDIPGARAAAERALPLFTRDFGPQHPHTVAVRQQLASLLDRAATQPAMTPRSDIESRSPTGRGWPKLGRGGRSSQGR